MEALLSAVSTPSEGPEHLWVVMEPPIDPKARRGEARVAAVLLHALLPSAGQRGPGTDAATSGASPTGAIAEAPLHEVARHAFIPEAIAASGDAVYLVFDRDQAGRREVLRRRVGWNEAVGRSYVQPPEGEPLPPLPQSQADLLGFAADSTGLYALMVASPAARFGVRRDGASESEPRDAILLRFERDAWIRVPFLPPTEQRRPESGEAGSFVEPMGLLSGPEGVRVLTRRGDVLQLSAVHREAPPMPVARLEREPPRGAIWFAAREGAGEGHGASLLFGEAHNADAGPILTSLVLRWSRAPREDGDAGVDPGFGQVGERIIPIVRPLARSSAAGEGGDSSGESSPPRSRWNVLPSRDGLILVIGAERRRGPSESIASGLGVDSLGANVTWARIALRAGDAANVPAVGGEEMSTVPEAVELQGFDLTDTRLAWIMMGLVLIVGTGALMIIAFIRLIRSPESLARPIGADPVAPGRRVAALIIDLAIPVGATYLLFQTLPRPPLLVTSWSSLTEVYAAATAIGLHCGHTFLTEWWWNQTLGKRAVGAKVISAAGGDPRFGQILLRSAFKALVLSAPILGVFTLLNREGRGIGDIASGTAVARVR